MDERQGSRREPDLQAGGRRRLIESYNRIRLTLAPYLALEFQLGADILSTAVAPSWNQSGKLGAIAVIRTALNLFLTREMRDERKTNETEGVSAHALPPQPWPPRRQLWDVTRLCARVDAARGLPAVEHR